MSLQKLDESLRGISSIINSTASLLYQTVANSDYNSFRETFKIYNTYFTSMNLLVEYISYIHYSIKFSQKKTDKIKKIKGNIIEHLTIIKNAIEEFAKITHMKDLQKIKDFLEEEISEIEKFTVTIPKVEGGYEITRKKISSSLKKIPDNFYETKIRGGDEYICGTEAAQDLKYKLIGLKNIKADFSDEKDYKENILVPMLASLFGVKDADLEKYLIVESNCNTKQKIENMVKRYKPQKILDEQISYILTNLLTNILDYCAFRSQKFSYEILNTKLICKNLDVNLDLANYKNMFLVIIKIVNYIDELDEAIFEKKLEEEFESYKKDITKIIEENYENYQILTDPSVNPLERHNNKAKIKEKISQLQDVLETSMDQKIKILKIKPNKEKIKKNKQIYEIAKYIVDYEIRLLPYYENIEKYYSMISQKLREIMELIIEMTSPDNRKTCIKKACLLATTIIRSDMLTRLTKHKETINLCTKIKEELLKLYPLNNDKNLHKSKKWYDSKRGLKIKKNMLESYIL